MDNLCINEVEFNKPFYNGLEFNAPVHGTWNIVHIGMNVPEAIQIYVCSKNCMRGVVLTAAEMNATDRFSYVIIEEKEMLYGDVENLTIEGVTDVLNKRKELPRAVELFTVCVHHFLGCDQNRIYRELEKRFPTVTFFRCYMDPIMQKQGLTPDQKLRRAIFEKLPAYDEDEVSKRTISVLGSDFLLDEQCDILNMANRFNLRVNQLPACKSFDEYLLLSKANVLVAIYPPAKAGVSACAARIQNDFLYLPSSFSYEEIDTEIIELFGRFSIDKNECLSYCDQMKNKCNELISCIKKQIGNTELVIDYTVHPRILGLTRLLLSNGFNVTKIYADSFNPEEEKDFIWLVKNYPDTRILPTVNHNMRHTSRINEKPVVAIGQKAAWFEETSHFVNLVSGGNLWGYDGIKKIFEMILDAFLYEKDTRDIVPRKGLGCESCL